MFVFGVYFNTLSFTQTGMMVYACSPSYFREIEGSRSKGGLSKVSTGPYSKNELKAKGLWTGPRGRILAYPAHWLCYQMKTLKLLLHTEAFD